MTWIRTDRRGIHYEPQPEAERCVEVLSPLVQEMALGLAKALAKVDATAAFFRKSCGSIGQYAAAHGLPASWGFQLRFVGVALGCFAWLEGRIRDGSFSFEQAVELGRLGMVEGALHEGDDWEAYRFKSLLELRRDVRTRLEETIRKKTGLQRFTVDLTPEGFEEFLRAHTLASRKAKRVLTRGEVIERVVREYVERWDMDRTEPGKRRMGCTCCPKCRTVPMETKRACRSFYGDQCWVPGCTNHIFLESMHVTPNCEGGSQEIENTGLGCSRHHTMFDAGEMWIIGVTSQGLPIFETKDGLIFHPDFPNRPLKKSELQGEEGLAIGPDTCLCGRHPECAPKAAGGKAAEETSERAPPDAGEETAAKAEAEARARRSDALRRLPALRHNVLHRPGATKKPEPAAGVPGPSAGPDPAGACEGRTGDDTTNDRASRPATPMGDRARRGPPARRTPPPDHVGEGGALYRASPGAPGRLVRPADTRGWLTGEFEGGRFGMESGAAAGLRPTRRGSPAGRGPPAARPRASPG